MSTIHEARHLTDAELLRVLDGEPPEPELRDTSAHLETCPECASALAALRVDSRLVTRWLERAAFEAAVPGDGTARGIDRIEGADGSRAPRRRRPGPTGRPAAASTRSGSRPGRMAGLVGSPWLKAAAILVLVAAPVAAFPGVRAWVVEQVAGPSAPPEAGAEAVTGEPMVLRFTPEPGDFVVRFERDAAGTITLDRSTDARAELRALDGDPETVVAASSLEIRNAGGDYTLRLPAAITGVWVMVGERGVAVSGDQIDRRTVVDLGRRYGQPAR